MTTTNKVTNAFKTMGRGSSLLQRATDQITSLMLLRVRSAGHAGQNASDFVTSNEIFVAESRHVSS